MSNEAYEHVCGELKLCPRLVPRPLWYISLASLARLEPKLLRVLIKLGEISETQYESYVETLDALHEIWFHKFSRQSKCSICGANDARHLDEDWRYYVDKENRKGIAVLVDIKPMCEKCHEAKHLGHAEITGKFDQAFAWFTRINNIDEKRGRRIVSEAFRVWKELSRIPNWDIKFDYLRLRHRKLIDAKYADVLDDIATLLVRVNTDAYLHGGVSFGDWIWIVNPHREQFFLISICNSLELLRKLQEGKLAEVVSCIENELRNSGVKVYRKELEFYLRKTLEDGSSALNRAIRLLEKLCKFCEDYDLTEGSLRNPLIELTIDSIQRSLGRYLVGK